MKLSLLLVFSALLGVTGCTARKQQAPAPRPRPVKVFRLEESVPLKPVQITGAVAAWKEQDMSFEVDGRVTMMSLEGAYLEGHWKVGDEIKHAGDVLGKLDPEPYEIARDTAQANLSVAQRELSVAQVELDQVMPARVKAAEAARDRAVAEYERKQKAVETNAISRLDFIYATAERDAQQANVEEVLADVEQQKATIESLQATVKQSEEHVRQAELDLRRCTLYARISGEVSELYVEAGGYTRRGSPVAHLVMMDPMKVDVSVAAETARDVAIGDSVNLFLPGDSEPTLGQVTERATVADPDTRTFRISVLARNWRTIPSVPAGDPRLKLPRVGDFQFLSRERFESGTGPYYVEENRALRRDAEGAYVWRAKGLSRESALASGMVVVAEKKRVVPGAGRLARQGIWTFVELADVGELSGGDLVLWDVPDGVSDGDELLVAREQWRLQPGQIVQVALTQRLPPRGFYAPMNAILPISESEGAVFVVADGAARRVDVQLRDRVGSLVRLEPKSPEGEKLLGGRAEVILDYIHFLRDGESVRVTRTVEVRT